MMISTIVDGVHLGGRDDLPEAEKKGYKIIDVRGFVDWNNSKQENLKSVEMFARKIHNALSQDKEVYVHCSGGFERSPLVVAYYLYKYRDFELRDAYKLITAIRPDVRERLYLIGM